MGTSAINASVAVSFLCGVRCFRGLFLLVSLN